MRDRLRRWHCVLSGHTNHIVWQRTGEIYCGRCGVLTSDVTREIKGDVTVHLR